MLAKIISLNAHEDEVPQRLYPSSPQLCSHFSVEVDQHLRVVICKKCQAVIDPFDFIQKISIEEFNHFDNIRLLKEKISKLNVEKTELIRVVTNLKAQKRRVSVR